MKRYTKEQILGARLCRRYDELIDEYFATHKTASILTILNAEGVDLNGKAFMILRLDGELIEKAWSSVESNDRLFYEKILANVRAELKK